MHAHDEDFLVVRTVEDADAPALGQVSDVAPHEVVVELLRRGLLERGHLAPLRIDAGHDVLDRAVFASRVHRLEDQQQGPAVLGVKHVLLFRQPRNAALEEFRGVALVQLQAAGVPRIEVLEAEAFAFGDTERVDVFLYTIEDFLSRHAPPPFREGAIYAHGVVGSTSLDRPSFATAHKSAGTSETERQRRGKVRLWCAIRTSRGYRQRAAFDPMYGPAVRSKKILTS